MTQLLQIATAMLAALNTGRPAGVPAAAFWSGIAVEADQLPVRTLAWIGETTERAGSPTSPLSSRRARFVVQDLVAGTGSGAGGQSPQEIAEGSRAWSIRALAGNRYLGSDGKPLAIDTVEIQTDWELEQGEEPFVRMTHHFDVSFTTRANDAEQRA